MEYKDYYKILGVEKSATADEIKKAFRRLARKYHPDVSKEENAEDKFKEAKEAYEVLKDAEKKAAYDQLGQGYQGGQGFEPPPGWEFNGGAGAQGHGAHGQGFSEEQFSDFFSSIFGGMHGGGRQQGHGAGGEFKQRGQDAHTKITVTLQEAYEGGIRVLELQEPDMDAQGQVHYKTRSLRIKIPAGVTDGQQIRLAGQGGKGIGGAPSGNLYLEVSIQPDKLYTTQGKDIHLNLPITPWEAALGAKIEVPTLGGKVGLNIPANSQSGQKLRLKGRGLPGKTAGNQFVTLKIVIPEPENDEQRELYKKMQEAMPFNPREALLS